MPDASPPTLPVVDPREHVLEVRDMPTGPVVIATDESLGRQALASLGPKASLRLLPDLALGAKTKGLVQVSVAPLRKEPRHVAEQLSQLQMGMEVDILEKANADWWRIRGHDGYLGYVHREHLMPIQPCWNTGYGGLPKRSLRVNYAQAWDNPFEPKEPVFDVSAGAVLAIGDRYIDLDGEGFTVFTPDMRRGYLKASQLMPMELRPFQPADLLTWARAWMGTPYLWGGTTPRGLDCSGLVQLAGWMAGRTLPRDASQQAVIGSRIDSRAWGDLLPGDLLFMGEKPGHITHVAIYEADGRYIHAAGRVRRNSLRPEDADFEPYRFETWQWTQRLTS